MGKKNPYLSADGGFDDEMELGYSEEEAESYVDIGSDDLSDIPDKPAKKKKAAAVEDDEDEDDDQAGSDDGDDDNDDADSDDGDDVDDEEEVEKPSKKTARRELEELQALKREIEELRNGNNETKKTQAALALVNVASQIEGVDREAQQLKAARLEARKKNNYDLLDAIEDRMKVLETTKAKLSADKTGLETYIRNVGNQKPLNPHAHEWASKRTWFNVNGNDEVSQFVKKKSQELAEKGYDISKSLHYAELDKVVKRKYPHLYAGGGGAFGGKKSGVAGTGSSAPVKRKDPMSQLPKATLRIAREAGLDITNKEVLARLAKSHASIKKGNK